ncbi:MAG: hypothetical protein QOK35_2755 [Pseudonocardiales bacterium]|nr:hypothetical protein [Pseudonocardiales bacterium]
MRAGAERRLGELRSEFEAGRRMLAELDARRAELQQTLLRIEGAVQVLEELTGAAGEGAGGAEGGAEDADADAAPANGRPATAGVG